VALEYKQEHGHATVHDQLTEASSVRDPAERHVFVTLMIAQSTENGVGGNHGDHAQNLVVVDHRPARARAPILLRPMVGRNAEERMNDHAIVILSLVLSTGNGVPGSSGVYARLPAA